MKTLVYREKTSEMNRRVVLKTQFFIKFKSQIRINGLPLGAKTSTLLRQQSEQEAEGLLSRVLTTRRSHMSPHAQSRLKSETPGIRV